MGALAKRGKCSPPLFQSHSQAKQSSRAASGRVWRIAARQPSSQLQLARANFAFRTEKEARDIHGGHGHEIRHLQCCYGGSQLYGQRQRQWSLAAAAAAGMAAAATGSRRNTHLLIAKDLAKSRFNAGLIWCRLAYILTPYIASIPIQSKLSLKFLDVPVVDRNCADVSTASR